MPASAFRRGGIDPLQVPDHRFDRRVQAVEIEAVEPDLPATATPVVEIAQPADEIHDVGVPPHPGREPAKPAEGIGGVAILADPGRVAAHPQRIGPIGLDRDGGEPFPLDQQPGDLGAFAVELVRTVGRLADENDAGVADPVDERPERVAGVRARSGGGAIRKRRDGDGGAHDALRSEAWFSNVRTSASVT